MRIQEIRIPEMKIYNNLHKNAKNQHWKNTMKVIKFKLSKLNSKSPEIN